MNLDVLIAMAVAEAARQTLDSSLVCAIIERESSWDEYAMRFEPAFYSRYVAARFPKGQCTESVHLATSFGLMQLMGLCAREIGFPGDLPVGWLLKPEFNIEFGCKLLRQKLTKAGGNISQALLYWNGGANKDYPVQVLRLQAKYGTAKLA